MSKTINLPFTCNELYWSLRIAPLLILLVGILDIIPYQPIVIFIGLSSTWVIWLYFFFMWDVEGKLPTFKCRCDK